MEEISKQSYLSGFPVISQDQVEIQFTPLTVMGRVLRADGRLRQALS